jgi:hypothetical protein
MSPVFWLTGLILLNLILLPKITRAQISTQESLTDMTGMTKTISRKEDFIVIRGAKTGHNLHREIDRLSVFAKVNDNVQPIPFQVDEINKEGEWILPDIPPYLDKSDYKIEQDEDHGKLDENDELVFMVRDSGDRMDQREYPPGAEAVDEIMLIDPTDNHWAWVYLCSFSTSSPPLSDKDYVSYKFPDNHIVSSNYKLGFSLEVPISWDYLGFRGEPDMVDRLKIRLFIKMFGKEFRLDETNFTSNLSAFKDGPVRVIRRVRSAVRLNKILKTPSAASETIYYQNAVAIPFRIKNPINLKPIKKLFALRYIKVRAGIDMQNLHERDREIKKR